MFSAFMAAAEKKTSAIEILLIISYLTHDIQVNE